MEQTTEPLPYITDEMIVEGQRFLNRTFGDDLLFPIYVVRAPTPSDTVAMSVTGGDLSLHCRDRIADWQGGGYLIRVWQERMDPLEFNTTLLHEAAHCLHPLMPTPVTENVLALGLPLPDNTPTDPRLRLPVCRRHFFHKPDFWRLCFHFWKRATLAGCECCNKLLGLTLADSDVMREAIEPETIDMLDKPLWKVARWPMPRNFEKLFDIDLSQFNLKETQCQKS